ncbi:MAG: hypothetical protein L3J82_00865 [Planctomycetes bacterium]|nr:hypothetical protein [Planctomycetota bacterium]
MTKVSKAFIFAACLAMVGALALPANQAKAEGFSVDDFLPPAQGGAVLVEEPEAVEIVEKDEVFEEIPVVKAASLQDGFNAAAEYAEEKEAEAAAKTSEGTEGEAGTKGVAGAMGAKAPDTFVIISSAGGIGFCVRASATYEIEGTQFIQRVSRRSAFVRANAAARVKLAEALTGMSVEAKLKVSGSSRSVTKSDGEKDTTGSAAENKTEEEITSTVEAMLKGVAIDRVEDNSEVGMVTVSVFVTPKTLGRGNRRSPELQTAQTLRYAMANIFAEVNSGIVPPVGGRVATSSTTGEMAWIGYGSAIVLPGKDKRTEAIGLLNAEKKAQMRAKSALLRMLRGESVYGESKLETSEKEIVEEIQKIEKTDPTTGKKTSDIEFLDKTRKLFESHAELSDISKSAAKGRLPAGVNIKTQRVKDANGKVVEVTAMAVFLPSLTEDLKKANLENLDDSLPDLKGSEDKEDAGSESGGPVEESESGKVGDENDR